MLLKKEREGIHEAMGRGMKKKGPRCQSLVAQLHPGLPYLQEYQHLGLSEEVQCTPVVLTALRG